jgi:transcriptional regulator with XRE-family HTH domain
MFYEQLKDIRKKRGFTIREVADRSGVSAAYISQIENGQRGTPSPEILLKLSEGLENSYAELMKLAGYIEPEGLTDANPNKPINLRRVLRENKFVLDGVPLTDDDVQWIDRMLTVLFSRDERKLQ